MDCLVWLLCDEPGWQAIRQRVQAVDAEEAVQLVLQAYGLAHVDVALVIWQGRLPLTRCNVWGVLWPAPLGE